LNNFGSQVEKCFETIQKGDCGNLVFQGLATGVDFTSMFWSAPGGILYSLPDVAELVG